MPDMEVKIGADTSEIDSAIEKVNQLKSLLQEVKETTDSLNLKILLNGKPISAL